MGFINGLQALIVGAAAAAGVVALYFLKLKRREYVISSTLLWKRSLNDLIVNSPFQRLRSSILLLLQLLLLALAALALARPVMNMRTSISGDIILLLDTSTSMNAREGGATRLELAKRSAKGIIGRMAKSDSMMILTFAGQCSVRKSFTSSKPDLERAVEQIEPGEGPTNVEDALSVAVSMGRSRGLAGREDQRILIISDGGFEDPAKLKVDGHLTATGIRIFTKDKRSFDIPLQFTSVGKSTRNVAITHVDVRRTSAKSAEIFVSVENFSSDAVDAGLSLYDRGTDGKGDELVSALAITLGVKGGQAPRTSRVFHIPQLADTLLEFKLDTDDDLEADNRVWLPLRKPRQPSVLLVTEGNYFLEKVLAPDADSTHQLSLMTPAAYPPKMEFDMTVFDRWAPAQLQPGSYLFVGAAPPVEGVLACEEVLNPDLLDWDHSHPLNRFVDFSGVHMARARRCELPIHAGVVVEGDKCPLIFAISEIDRRIVCVAFNLVDSESRLNTDWPFRVSFPVFFSNAINWLNPEAHGSAPALIQVGSPISFNLPADAHAATITDPRGREFTVEADKERRVAFGKTALPGPYLATVKGKDDTWIAANVLSRRESDIAVRESFDWRGSPIEGTDAAKETPSEVWKYFGLAAIVFLMGEWYVYHRGGR